MSVTEVVPANRSRIPAGLQPAVRAVQARLQVGSSVVTGQRLRLGLGSSVRSPHGLTIGHDASIGQRTHIEVDGRIGNFALVGRDVQILGRADHALDRVGVPIAFSEWVGDRPEQPQDRIEIGDDVWIGGGAILLGGIVVGEGAVIGAGSIVTKDVAPYSIVAGAPARVLRQRFASDAERADHALALRGMRERLGPVSGARTG